MIVSTKIELAAIRCRAATSRGMRGELGGGEEGGHAGDEQVDAEDERHVPVTLLAPTKMNRIVPTGAQQVRWRA